MTSRERRAPNPIRFRAISRPRQIRSLIKVAQIPKTRNNPAMPFDAYVSILAMPVGVTICFGPALLFWWLAERKDAQSSDKK